MKIELFKYYQAKVKIGFDSIKEGSKIHVNSVWKDNGIVTFMVAESYYNINEKFIDIIKEITFNEYVDAKVKKVIE